MTNYLFKRGTRYYIRRKIPIDLQAHYGRKEIIRALGTSECAIAGVICRAESVRIDEMFAEARLANATTKLPAAEPRSEQASSAPMTGAEAEAWELARVEYELEADLVYAETYRPLTDAEEAIEHDRIERELRREAEEREQRIQEAMEAIRRMGVALPAPNVPPAALMLPAPSDSKSNAAVITLRDVVPYWKARNASKANAVARVMKALDLFEDAVGMVSLPDIKKSTGATFVNFLLDSTARKFARKTASNHAAAINALINVAVKEDLLDRNPLDLAFNKHVGAKSRDPWTDTELATIFSSPLFSGTWRNLPRWENVGPLDGRAVLMLLLHTGARPGEIAQLRCNDFVTRNGVRAIHITPEAGTVKTRESERFVPLADNLLSDPWFAGWMSDLPEDDTPALSSLAGRARGPGDTFGQWFRKFREAYGLPKGPLFGAHKFRHWLRSALAEKHIGDSTMDAITGHSAQGSSGSKVYTATAALPVMKAALDSISYPRMGG